MVDFRYHIVSIVAIFLALAIGIVLGAGPLKTTSDAGLKTQVSDLRANSQTLQNSLSSAQSEIQFLDTFGAQAAPSLLAERLAGLQVAVVSLPGADPALAAAVLTSLQQADATVSVQARITSSWTDPGHQAALASALHAGVSPAASPSAGSHEQPRSSVGPTAGATGGTSPSASPVQSASATVYSDIAAELAAGLLTTAVISPVVRTSPAPQAPPAPGAAATPRRSAGPVLTPTRSTAAPLAAPPASVEAPAVIAARTLAALVAAGFVDLSDDVPPVHPTLAVVVAGDPPATADDTSRAATAELATLAEALRAGSDGTVVTGSAASAGAGGLLSLIRASRPTAGELSTVDSVDTVVGRIAVPLALVQQQAGGEVGQYGSVGSTNGPLPPVNGIGPG